MEEVRDNMRIVFMGNPEFAVASLEKIFNAGYEIAAVVTGPDRAAGRGLKVQHSPVKEFALKHGLKILQPEKLKAPDFLEELKSLNADLGVVIAFRMLPEVVWSMPPLGTINLHASLLPQYRGAAPINRVIMNGEKVTGLTTFFLRQEIDTGKIIFSEKIPIGENETAGELHDRMMVSGADLVLRTLEAIKNNSYPQAEQEGSSELKTAPKIFREDCRIDWEKTVDEVHDLIRGLSPYPAAFTIVKEKQLKIFLSAKEYSDHSEKHGQFFTDGKTTLKAAVSKGYIHLLEVQPEGKKRMKIDEFLRGYAGWVR